MSTFALVQQVKKTEDAVGQWFEITLPSPPTPGNMLLLYGASAIASGINEDPILSIDYHGLTWFEEVRQYSSSEGPTQFFEISGVLPFGVGLTVRLEIRWMYRTFPLAVILTEYSGIKKDSAGYIDEGKRKRDRSNNAMIGNLDNPTVVANDLLIAGVANANGATRQVLVTNGFTEVTQVSTDPSGDNSHVNIGFYMREVNEILPAGWFAESTLSASHTWTTQMFALLPDESIEDDRSVDIGMYIIDFQDSRTVGADVAVAESSQIAPLDLNIAIQETQWRFVGLSFGIVERRQSHRIVESDNSGAEDWFKVDGDITSVLGAGAGFTIIESGYNDDTYIVQSSSYLPGELKTQVVVTTSLGPSFSPPAIHTIIDVSGGGSGYFAVPSSVINFFPPGKELTVVGSTGNDGTYTVDSSFFALFPTPRTLIYVTTFVPSAVVDGSVHISYDGLVEYSLASSTLLQGLQVSITEVQTFIATTEMSLSIFEPIFASMNVLIDFGMPLTAHLNVSITHVPELTDAITTPEDDRYVDCRPLWCGVPKQKNVGALLQALIMGGAELMAGISLWVSDGPETLDLEPDPADGVADFSYGIIGVDAGADIFTVGGQIKRLPTNIAPLGTLTVGSTFTVSGSTGNDNIYTVVAISSFDPTAILVSEDITDATVDGSIDIDIGKTYAGLQLYIADRNYHTFTTGMNVIITAGRVTSELSAGMSISIV